MAVCIHRNVLGEPFHLLHDEDSGKFRKVGTPPDGCWIVGDPSAELSIDRLALVSGSPIQLIPSGPYGAMAAALRREDPGLKICWRHVLPDGKFVGFVQELLDGARSLLGSGNVGYYLDVFRTTSGCLRGLEKARIDEDRLYSHYAGEKNESNRSTLKSCFPDPNGFARPIVYNQSSTVTGRLVVESGPRILTLPKRYRDSFRSRYDGGTVGILDYRSLEPRISLSTVGRPVPDDVYDDINLNLFGNSFERERVKVMAISILYGAQEETFGRLSGLTGSERHEAMDKIGSYFGIRLSRARLVKQLEEHGFITNIYGRVIRPAKRAPNLLYNNYIQSSAVDAALLGFAQACDLIRSNGWKIHPLFVIHDALMLDVHPGYAEYIGEVKVACRRVPGLEVELPVKYEEIARG